MNSNDNHREVNRDVPRGSQKPTGGRAPISEGVIIFREADRATRADGAKPKTASREVRAIRMRNIVIVLVTSIKVVSKDKQRKIDDSKDFAFNFKKELFYTPDLD